MTSGRPSFHPRVRGRQVAGDRAAGSGRATRRGVESVILKQAFSPVMGASILLGLLVCALRVLRAWSLGRIEVANA